MTKRGKGACAIARGGGDVFRCGGFENGKKRRCCWKIIGPLMCVRRKSELATASLRPDWQWRARRRGRMDRFRFRETGGTNARGRGWNGMWKSRMASLRAVIAIRMGGRSMEFMIEQ